MKLRHKQGQIVEGDMIDVIDRRTVPDEHQVRTLNIRPGSSLLKAVASDRYILLVNGAQRAYTMSANQWRVVNE